MISNKHFISDIPIIMDMLIKALSKVPLCIWGLAGIGKTLVIKSYCINSNILYKVTPAAQLQLTGDLLGLPTVVNGELIKTAFARSLFLPKYTLDKFIWIIDDINRANSLILQALLHLLQFKEFGQHKLGPNTYIVLTANPENGLYQVHDIDMAFKTRLFNVLVNFDQIYWARWAQLNKKISSDAINFILRYPLMVCGYNGDDTLAGVNNIRSWTNGFLTGDILGVQLAVGNSYAVIYQKFIDEYSKIMLTYDINLIFTDPDKFIELFKNKDIKRDVTQIMVWRIASLNLDNYDNLDKMKIMYVVYQLSINEIIDTLLLMVVPMTFVKHHVKYLINSTNGESKSNIDIRKHVYLMSQRDKYINPKEKLSELKNK